MIRELEAAVQEFTVRTKTSKQREGEEEALIHYVILCMQNFCEGDFREMKDYMRYQENGNISFNLVKETAHMIMELEGEISQNLRLANQLVRTLTEFATGCPSNQLALMDAKIYASFNRIFSQMPACDELEVVQLKVSHAEASEVFPF